MIPRYLDISSIFWSSDYHKQFILYIDKETYISVSASECFKPSWRLTLTDSAFCWGLVVVAMLVELYKRYSTAKKNSQTPNWSWKKNNWIIKNWSNEVKLRIRSEQQIILHPNFVDIKGSFYAVLASSIIKKFKKTYDIIPQIAPWHWEIFC